MSPLEALEQAVSVLGGQTALALVCDRGRGQVKQQHVWNWLNRDGKLPEKYALLVERACADKGTPVLARDLCPEMFPDFDLAASDG